MFNTSNIFNTLFVIPILNLLIGCYDLLNLLHVPYSFGFSLIILTFLIKLLLYPLTLSQLKNAHKLGKLKPKLDELNKLHKDDKQRLQQEQLRLYQEAGVNPAAGCLPLLLQMPILIALYNLFFQLLNTSDLNTVIAEVNKVVYFPFLKISSLDLSFFGMNLAYKPSQWQQYGWWLLAVPVITAALQYWQTKIMTPISQPVADDKKIVKKDGKEEKKGDDFATSMQKQMTIMMPLMIGFFAYSFPLGLSLYWNAFSVFGIIQQYQVNKQLEK